MPKHRRIDVEHLAAARRAAKAAGAAVGQWWKTLSVEAETTTTEQSLDKLVRDAIRAMTRALEVDTVAILLANEQGDELIARAAVGLPEEFSLDLGIRSGQGMAGWVLAQRRPLIVADLSKITVVSPALRNSGLRSVAAVPVLSDDHPLGVLYAGSYELDRFDASDIGMLELVAERLSSAIERVRLFETERAARTEAEHLADRLARLQSITATLAATNNVDEVATVLAASMLKGQGDKGLLWASVWLLDEDALNPISVATHALDGPSLRPVALSAEHPIAIAARRKQARYYEQPAENEQHFPVLSLAFPLSSFAVIPIMLNEACLGVLVAIYRGAHVFSTDEREILSTVVGQVAQALERARLSVAQEQLADISAFFARAAKVLAEGSDLADTLARLASVALPALGDICLIDVMSENGRVTRMVAKHRDHSSQHLVDRLRFQYSPVTEGPHPAAAVIRTGESLWSEKMSDEFLAATTIDEDHLALTKALGFRSYISVPLQSDGETLGCVTLVSVTRSFSANDVAVAG